MFCVFLVSDDEKTLLDFFKSEKSARHYMDTIKHLKLNGILIMDYLSLDSIKSYINNVFSKEVKK